jgi:dUTP pyrophosphatase
MKVKIKKLHPDAVIPKYAKEGDAGMDLVAVSNYEIVSVNNEFCYIEYKTGLSFEIPEGHVGFIFPRSSISKKALTLANSVGVIDSGYRGEVSFRFRYDVSTLNVESAFDESKAFYNKGDRIGQIIIIPYPQIEFEEVDKLNETERGDGGFGSSGN